MKRNGSPPRRWHALAFLIALFSGWGIFDLAQAEKNARVPTSDQTARPRANSTTTRMESPRAGTTSRNILVSPLEDDAAIHDLHFVGTQNGWAVGDHGVVWKTTNGGSDWEFCRVPRRATFRSVCFLTDRVGWVGGGETESYTQVRRGVLLSTRDGGLTWQDVSKPTLPPLVHVQFFDLKHGVAVGEAAGTSTTGVWTTADGGRSWRPLEGEERTGWRGADFLDRNVGALAGLRGQASLVGGGKLLQPRLANLGLQGLHAIRLQRDETGWMVGDGGLALRTENGGVVWQLPATPLPAELRHSTDFRAVETRGSKVWIAGQPGSTIWHSSDHGATWQRQSTGETSPLEAICFANDHDGWAAGAFGTILRTRNGGRTWEAVRGGNRRAAVLVISARATTISFPLLVRLSADEGYRSVAVVPVRYDLGPDGGPNSDLDQRLQDALASAGVSSGQLDWQFPIATPGLERRSQKLLESWSRLSDGELATSFLGKLTAQIRYWRPSVVILDEERPAEDETDAVGRIVADGALKAIEHAADATRFIEHQELLGLKPWQVQRVYRRQARGSISAAQVDRFAYLPRLNTTVDLLATEASSRLQGGMRIAAPQPDDRLPKGIRGDANTNSTRESFRTIFDRDQPGIASPINRDFFHGLVLMPNSDARRQLFLPNERDLERQQALARRQRNLFAYLERFPDDSRHAAQLLANFRESTRGMRDDQAASTVLAAAREYRRRGEWELLELAYIELVNRFPNEPAAVEGMLWLFQTWGGGETSWSRARRTKVGADQLQTDLGSMAQKLERAIAQATEVTNLETASFRNHTAEPLRFLEKKGNLNAQGRGDVRDQQGEFFQQQALRMAELIRRKHPRIYRSPEVQFPLAALARQRGGAVEAAKFYGSFDQAGAGNRWKKTALAEMWVLNPIELPPKKLLVCRKSAKRPVLDGVLSDPCWQEAVEIRLSSQEEGELAASPSKRPVDNRLPRPIAFFSWDQEYLYLAASIPHSVELPRVEPKFKGRKHDADLTDFDRLSLFLDLDRDYLTWYEFQIDQRGQTSESCGERTDWNPGWFVACDSDKSHWRIEAAIPWKNLSPRPPAERDVWAMGLVRTIPTVGLQSWTHPASSHPRPDSFGLIRFDP